MNNLSGRPVIYLVAAASIFVILFGIRGSAYIINPILLAAVITITVLPIPSRLTKRGLPGWLALVLSILMVVLLLGLVIATIFFSITKLSTELPTYLESASQHASADLSTTTDSETSTEIEQVTITIGPVDLKGRDQLIGWSPEQCRSRRALLANNARFLILPGHHLPNLASRVMKWVLERLSDDWQERFKHPIVLVESFVDPEQFRGTTYRCTGWSPLGLTQGYGRQAKDFYVEHQQPKQLWVKALVKNATVKLRAEHLPEAWAVVEQKVKPRCTAKTAELTSLTDHLARIPEYRSAHALGYPLAGLLCLIAVATFAGVVRGEGSGRLCSDTLPASDAGAAVSAPGFEVPEAHPTGSDHLLSHPQRGR